MTNQNTPLKYVNKQPHHYHESMLAYDRYVISRHDLRLKQRRRNNQMKGSEDKLSLGIVLTFCKASFATNAITDYGFLSLLAYILIGLCAVPTASRQQTLTLRRRSSFI